MGTPRSGLYRVGSTSLPQQPKSAYLPYTEVSSVVVCSAPSRLRDELISYSDQNPFLLPFFPFVSPFYME